MAEDLVGLAQRLTRLESSVEEQRRAVAEIAADVKAIAADVAKEQQPHWNLWISAMALLFAVIGSTWAISTRPMAQDITRLQTDLKQHELVVEAMRRQMDSDNLGQQRLQTHLESLEKEFVDVREQGSPITRERLGKIEYRLDALAGKR